MIHSGNDPYVVNYSLIQSPLNTASGLTVGSYDVFI